ncbi:OLC1v1000876C1 [Oldenlandia corymbosa var. corymbosa]|uniref:OLC1v1000876C1 n=1 Tax=Oldenlandia corymbosa var. corymbosa TaxID=529605 RepID=A0AAV1D697_OLDCO|nr:OLC1v1000876C1 [Oldenlandia corymbosa var. corymbosa]
MAEAEGKRPLSIWSDDVEGTHSESVFRRYIGAKMRRSGSSSPKRFMVFSIDKDDIEDDEIGYGFPGNVSRSIPPGNDCAVIKDRIRAALENVDFGYCPSILAQFFAPVVTVDGRRVLKSLNEPFGMTCLGKGLCSYRSLSSNFQYACSLNGNDGRGGSRNIIASGIRGNSWLAVGPPSRVFVNGSPEYSPDVEFYSDAEYPSRDEILKLAIKKYMAVPVFKNDSRNCVGVLELVSSSSRSKREIDKPAYIFGLISTALQGVGLRTSAFTSHFEMETNLAQSSEGRRNALRDIQAALEETCIRHNLPFAQTWTDRDFKSCSPLVLSTTSDEYYQSHLGFSMFRDTCEGFHLPFGRGVVWKAFGTGGSCFCEDVGQLSIADYSFAHIARKVRLSAAFAICLKSHHHLYMENPDNPDVYVLELFLPSTAAGNPQKPLELVLLTMRKLLNGFITGSDQTLDSGIDVQVLQVSKKDDNKQVTFRLFPDSGIPIGGLVGLLDQSAPISTEQQHKNFFPQSGSSSSSVSATAGHAGIQNSFNSCHGYRGSLDSFRSWDGNEEVMHLNRTRGLVQHHASTSSTSLSLKEDQSSDTTPSMMGAGSFIYHNNSSASTSWFQADHDEDYRMEEEDEYRMVGCMDLNNESPEPSNSAGLLQQHACFSTSPPLKEDQYSFDTLSMSTGTESCHHQNNNSCALTTSEVECFQRKMVIKNTATLAAQINRESIATLFGCRLEDAARSLKVSKSTLKRRCRDLGILSWPRYKSSTGGATCNFSGNDSGKQNVTSERNHEFAVSAEMETMFRKNQATPVAVLPDSSFLTIKAQCGKKMIKFKLPFSSKLVQMESEVASRLKLAVGSFNMCYMDEDDEFILLTCDSDMQTMESMGKLIVRLCVTPGDTAPE